MIRLNDLHLKETVNFRPIPVQIEMDTITSTNKDQDTFIRFLRVMVTGQNDEAGLALRMPTLSSVRLLSCATWTLRVYVSTQRPSYILERVVNYIVKSGTTQEAIRLLERIFSCEFRIAIPHQREAAEQEQKMASFKRWRPH